MECIEAATLRNSSSEHFSENSQKNFDKGINFRKIASLRYICFFYEFGKSFSMKNFWRLIISKLLDFLVFFSIWVFFHQHSRIKGLQVKGESIFLNSLLPLAPASQTLRHCRELTSAQRQQPHSKQEPLVSERKSLTTNIATHP